MIQYMDMTRADGCFGVIAENGEMAIYHRKLDEEIIRPLIEQEAATATGNNLSVIQDAIKDINFAMGWGIEAK